MSKPNEEQRRRWNEEEGDHWVAEAGRFDQTLAPYGERVLAALAPEPEERILDVGCGNGALSLDIAARVGPQGSVLGLDLSGPMLSLATRRAGERGLGNASFVKGDAQVHDFGDRRFDGLVSRFGVMFFDDPVAAFTNLRGAMASPGRLAFACWQEVFRNDWLMVPAMTLVQYVPMPELPEPGTPGPFALADADRTKSILEQAGWLGVNLDEVETRQWLGTDPPAVVEFLARTEMAKIFLSDQDDATVAKAWKAVEAALDEHTDDDGVHLTGRAWLVTARSSG